jgi:peptidoglycan/LPS O-acetylase OafA/YrhL
VPTAAAAAQPRWWADLQEKLDRAEIPALNGIRAVAVWLVITFHFGETINGALGVTMFFTLSGFLITWLLLKEVDATGTVSLKQFYIRRTRRIFPALYCYIALGVAIYLLRGHPVPWADVIASALYLQNYYDAIFHSKDSFVGHTWSLGIEEQFYLLWPLLLIRLRHDLRALTRALLGIIALAWVLRLVLQYGLHANQGYIYHAFETRMDQLAIGCLLAVLLRRGQWSEIWRVMLSHPLTPALVIGCIAASSLFHGQVHYRYPLAYTLEPLLTALLIVTLIVQSEHAVWRHFNHPVMRFIGRISYSLYLYQQLTLSTARRLTEHLPLFVQYAFAWAVTIGFALLSYHFVEKRLRSPRHAAA